MLKALLWKEFRELMPLCVAAFAAEIMLFGFAIHGSRTSRAADVWTVFPMLWLVANVVPLVAGFWQNSHEDSQNTFLFLLQRPVSRRRLFGAKLLFGALVCLLLCLVPMLGFLAFAETIYPDRISNSFDMAWMTSAGIWLLYLGAFISGLRPGPWYRTRYLPLFAGIFLYVVLQMFYEALGPKSPIAAFTILSLSLFFATGFAVVAIHVGNTREYS